MDLAIGFITKDLLPNGETIMALWNRSPFDALRVAPPLSETPDPELVVTELPELPASEEDEDEDEDEEEDEYEEEEEEYEEEEEVAGGGGGEGFIAEVMRRGSGPMA
jgi:phage repressor protein C with HTH and peptisase S24 domain